MTTPHPSAERVLNVPEDQTRWDTFAPRYQALLAADLSAGAVPDWLAGWSALTAEVGQAGSKLATHADLHTDDEATQARYARFLEEVSPQVQRASRL